VEGNKSAYRDQVFSFFQTASPRVLNTKSPIAKKNGMHNFQEPRVNLGYNSYFFIICGFFSAQKEPKQPDGQGILPIQGILGVR
jgi:hypothetical protein